MGIVSRLVANFERYGKETAIFFNGKSATYLDVGNRSCAIATLLSERGIRRQCIAVEIENPAEHIIAILGILLSGNYYLTVTPENSHHVAVTFPLQIQHSIVALSDSNRLQGNYSRIYFEDIVPLGKPFLANFTIADDVNFCALITSGTSGAPKVVVHTHKTINEDITRQIKDNSITAADKLDLIFSMSFSAALSCIFPALVSGAELCLYPVKQLGMGGLVRFWEERKVTYTTMSVSTFQAVCKFNPSLHHLPVRCVAIGAEPITMQAIDLFRSRFPASTRLKIAYASTETRTIAQLILGNNDHLDSYNYSLGRAVTHKKVYASDEHGIELPAGTLGEIVVESGYIASGYVGDALATDNAFSSDNGTVIYRTGDLGYVNDAGEIFYKGRKHNEVKLNGVKIDLSLIEQQLEQLPNVVCAVVVINDSRPGKKHLVAFIQSNEAELTVAELNTSLNGKLPGGHLPHFYCRVADFPQTHTDKVDRKRLETMEFAPLMGEQHTNQQPRSELEQIIIDAFNAALEIENTQPDNSFFNDLGGDSLMSLAVIASLEARLQLKIPAYSLWVYPTPQKLAVYLDSGFLGKKVHCALVNEYSPAKRNFYFINRFRGGNDYAPIISKLSPHFNIMHLLHESEALENIEGAEALIQELGDAIRSQANDRGAIVLGLSFQGFIAQQLTATIAEIRDCVLLDTFNYFKITGYARQRSKVLKALFMLKNTVVARDSHILKKFIAGRFPKANNEGAIASPFRTNRKHMFWHDYYKKVFGEGKHEIPHNCVFFRATRDFVTHPTHGYNWKAHVKGNFKIFNVKCTHLEITAAQHSELIATRILEVIEP